MFLFYLVMNAWHPGLSVDMNFFGRTKLHNLVMNCQSCNEQTLCLVLLHILAFLEMPFPCRKKTFSFEISVSHDLFEIGR